MQGLRVRIGPTLLSLMFAFVFIGCGEHKAERTPPPIVDGTLDLRGWSFEHDGPVELSGQWHFAWKSFVSIAPWAELQVAMPLLLEVPRSWEGHEDALNFEGPVGLGYGTYALRILWDDEVPLAIINDGPQFAGTLEIYRGDLTLESRLRRGTPSTTPEEERPFNRFYSILPFNAAERGGEIIVMVQVSSHHYPRGGLRRPVVLDRLSSARTTLGRHFGQAATTLGVLVVIGLYHLILFVMRRQQLRALYFALFCFSVALRELVMSGLLTSFGYEPSFQSFLWLFKLEYFSLPAMVFFGGAYVMALLPQRWFERFVWWGCGGFGLILAAISLFESAGKLPDYLNAFQGYILVVLMTALAHLGHQAWTRNPLAKSILFSFGIIATGAVNDILHTNGLIQTAFLASYSVIAFVLLQSIILSRANAQAYAERDRLNERVMLQTTRLADESKARALAEAEARLEAESKILLFSNTVHHLNNPLNHIQGITRMASDRAETLEEGILELLGEDESDPLAVQVRAQFEAEFDKLLDEFTLLESAAQRSASTVKLLRIVSGMDGTPMEPSSLGELCRILELRVTGSLQDAWKELGLDHGQITIVGHPVLYAEALELVEGALRGMGLPIESVTLSEVDGFVGIELQVPGVEDLSAYETQAELEHPLVRANGLVGLLLKSYRSELVFEAGLITLRLETPAHPQGT